MKLWRRGFHTEQEFQSMPGTFFIFLLRKELQKKPPENSVLKCYLEYSYRW